MSPAAIQPRVFLSLAILAVASLRPTQGYVPTTRLSLTTATTTSRKNVMPLFVTATETSSSDTATVKDTDMDMDFASFADSLDAPTTTPQKDGSSTATTTSDSQSWQACVDELLDPITPLSRRQALLAKLVNANQDIQESVLTAMKERKIDGLLTPTTKKLQDGTQVVARQITNDILPNLARTAGPPRGNPGSMLPPILPDPTDVNKIGSRILNALSNQVAKNLEILRGDLANPVRIPQRISKQTEGFVTEARNVFSETPVGLEEPAYTVVVSSDASSEYEIRDYEGYSVASTSMGKGVMLAESSRMERSDVGTNLAETGAAFNTLAAYLFGANKQGESMEMTTPVTTTSWGEMRFYLSTRNNNNNNQIPDPLDDASSGSLYETGAVTVLDIPAARLAVKKFTGFVTEGEINRQKDALLSALMMDDVELDVAHGDPISHVIFQYNPPYTLPIVRRNEIAVAVRREDDVVDLQKQWAEDAAASKSSSDDVDVVAAHVAGGDDSSPSD